MEARRERDDGQSEQREDCHWAMLDVRYDHAPSP